MIILLLANVLFFWNFYTQPYQMATSELLSTFFPTWIWQGREWIKGRVPKYDPYYWIKSNCYPVLSTYYPINIISSMVGAMVDLNRAFNLFIIFYFSHFVFASIGWFILLQSFFPSSIALFGTIAFTYLPYHWKQQPSIVYTLSWFPWIFKLKGIAIGMMLLAGYYPLAIYLLPLGLFLNHDYGSWGLGFLIGSIQLVPFLKHLPKTIKGKIEAPSEPGPWETNFYIGIVPIILFSTHLQWELTCFIFLLVLLIYLVRQELPRIYQRAWIVPTYLILYQSLRIIPKNLVIPLLILHLLDLWLHTRNLPFYKPYSELWEKPSRAFNTCLTRFLQTNLKDRVSGLPWPLFTGHINRLKTIGYCGSLQTQEMYSWRRSFKHDPFIDGVNEHELTKHRIQFFCTRKRINLWLSTPVKNLYRNPNYC